MFSDDTRKRLENIVRGIILEREEDTCTTARNLLCGSFTTSTTVKKDFAGQSIVKKEQAKFLRHHSSLRNWWVHELPGESSFLTRLGFTENSDSLLAVLKQPFISSDAPVDLSDVQKLLAFNGFENTKRNDYFNKELGLILEDMHDENIIANSNTLFFIDTVFYTVSG